MIDFSFMAVTKGFIFYSSKTSLFFSFYGFTVMIWSKEYNVTLSLQKFFFGVLKSDLQTL